MLSTQTKWRLLLISIAILSFSCTSKLKIVQNYPHTPNLEAAQKAELLQTLQEEFPEINEKNIEQALLPYVLIKGEAYALTQFISFDPELHHNFQKNKLDFVPYWKLRRNPHTYVLYLEGSGWRSSLWGYLVFDELTYSIVSISFFHGGETRSHGGDISLDWYQEQYAGAKLCTRGRLNFMSNPKHEVYQFGDTKIDGTSGATMTNNGLQAMFNNMLRNYEPLILGFIE